MVTATQEKRVEELAMDAEKAPEPGGQMLIEQDGENEVPQMTVKQLMDAGWVYIYVAKTGERRLTNKNMLVAQLGKMVDGERYFTTGKVPFAKIKQGSTKCLLHKDDPNRAHYDEMGLPVCKKANMISPFQRDFHMQKKHKMEWKAIEAERIEKERAEERELRQLMLKQNALALKNTVKRRRLTK